mgnify:CR=1 FL=1
MPAKSFYLRHTFTLQDSIASKNYRRVRNSSSGEVSTSGEPIFNPDLQPPIVPGYKPGLKMVPVSGTT